MSEFLVKHRGEDHDIGRFLHFHPGGSNTLHSFQNCDVTKQFEKIHHSPAAYELLKDYRIKNDSEKIQEFDLEVGIVNLIKPCICSYFIFFMFYSSPKGILNYVFHLYYRILLIGKSQCYGKLELFVQIIINGS